VFRQNEQWNGSAHLRVSMPSAVLHRLDDDVPVCSTLLANTYDIHITMKKLIFVWKRGVLAPTRIRASYLKHILVVFRNVKILQSKNPS
jgi:hypothetical protein